MQSIRTASDIVLRNRTFKIVCNPKYELYYLINFFEENVHGKETKSEN